MTRRWFIVACLGIPALCLAGVLVVTKAIRVDPPAVRTVAGQGTEHNAPHHEPTLYCDFYNVMHNATVVSFYFAVGLADAGQPKVSELFVVEPDGTKTEFGTDSSPTPPQWAYKLDDGTPTITSPDAATVIVLYGLKPRASGSLWVEAGLRSNDYRNLEGKCRQSNFVEAAR